DLEAIVTERAWKDDEFRRRLDSDPRAALEQSFGMRIPADVSVSIHEESPSEVHLVIPVNPDRYAPSVGLSDEELSVTDIPVTITCYTCTCLVIDLIAAGHKA